MAHTPSSMSGTSTPSSLNPRDPQSSSSYLSYPVSHVTSWLSRRLTESSPSHTAFTSRSPSQLSIKDALMAPGVYTPPHRTASPFQPPPLTPLTLSSSEPNTILSKAVAEEIRLLVPPRLQLAESWGLVYSLERDGATTSTLYHKCISADVPQDSSFVLVVQDGLGGVFGAYLTDPPKPSPSFYGTGECFLWRASLLPAASNQLLSNLPPPPSAPEADEGLMGRSTTIRSPTSPTMKKSSGRGADIDLLTGADGDVMNDTNGIHRNHTANANAHGNGNGNMNENADGASTPSGQLLRFKAFPYSGVNDYLIFCEPTFLSVGGGDGKYGLWLDGNMERGISGQCMTFGNEALSEEGEKFEIVGVEVWCVGSG